MFSFISDLSSSYFTIAPPPTTLTPRTLEPKKDTIPEIELESKVIELNPCINFSEEYGPIMNPPLPPPPPPKPEPFISKDFRPENGLTKELFNSIKQKYLIHIGNVAMNRSKKYNLKRDLTMHSHFPEFLKSIKESYTSVYISFDEHNLIFEQKPNPTDIKELTYEIYENFLLLYRSDFFISGTFFVSELNRFADEMRVNGWYIDIEVHEDVNESNANKEYFEFLKDYIDVCEFDVTIRIPESEPKPTIEIDMIEL